jgi:hypothetical protein
VSRPVRAHGLLVGDLHRPLPARHGAGVLAGARALARGRATCRQLRLLSQQHARVRRAPSREHGRQLPDRESAADRCAPEAAARLRHRDEPRHPAFFKYSGLLTSTAARLLDRLGLADTGGYDGIRILLPLAIAFFTFEMVSALVDVYRGDVRVGRFLPFAAYKAYFPKLISGPITRYAELGPSSRTRLR